MGATEFLDDGRLADLRRRLVARGRAYGLPLHDVEDLVQDALIKVLRERSRPGQPPVEIRALTALRDVRAEHFRRHSRETARVSTTGDELGDSEPPTGGSAFSSLDVVELCESVRRLVGTDVMTFAVLKSMGATEADVATLMGWAPRRAAAARVQLSRKRRLLIEAMSRDVSPYEEER